MVGIGGSSVPVSLPVSMPLAAGAAATTAPSPRYGRDIRPLLSDRCFECHGPDEAARQAGLRLDVYEGATAARRGGAAIVPGNPAGSAVMARISSTDPDEVMPPPSAGKKPLTREERELIARWIGAGAEYEPHWALVPPKKHAAPAPRSPQWRTWASDPLDMFILAGLESAGLFPSPEADRATLVRRVFLDLTGLPPTPEESAAFVADPAPDAYERLVDRLLTQEPYRTRAAERLTMPWLDQARYADTSGIHMDAGRQMWLWRDWVIAAFRDNMPYDRFIVEQLAGDLLPDATVAQKIASGFNRNHVTTDEGGAIAEEYLVEYASERTNTTASVFLGLTMGCARCHDHKYDPVSTADYYSMFAFFNSIEEPGLYSQLPDPTRAFEPFILVPTPEQEAQLASLATTVESLRSELRTPSAAEEAARSAFFDGLADRLGVRWASATLLGATSSEGSVLTPQDDGSVLASGPTPDRDSYTFSLRTDERSLDAIAVEALRDASLPNGSVGRAPNGNALLTRITARVTSLADPSKAEDVELAWAWADHEQPDGEHAVVNSIDGSGPAGWALDGHRKAEDRVAIFRAARPFGFDGGSEVRITLDFSSIYSKHAFGRVRVTLGAISRAGSLPVVASPWRIAGPFVQNSTDDAYARRFGPEDRESLDGDHQFAGAKTWMYAGSLPDGVVHNTLPTGSTVTYLGRYLYSPSARSLSVSLGSDDGFQIYVNGVAAAERRVERSAAADQDRATLELREGRNTVVFKIINTSGTGGMFFRSDEGEDTIAGDLLAAVAPPSARSEARMAAAHEAWRMRHSPRVREVKERLVQAEARRAAIDAATARTMVMKELQTPRETFVLTRGEYNKPDRSRPVTRAIPRALGSLPPDAPRNRLGLARWIVSPDNPLTARVVVNRTWEMFFGHGIVRTTEDFGLQGEWPSHPELLDTLAVEFREGGWDLRGLIRRIVTSRTYRQSSRHRPEALAADPDNRLLAFMPRLRLSGEQIRDQALYVSGLLVERAGGPSVKPYQPEGLWQEVAMVQSNTRVYERGKGDDLWRRSLYTYWKRAAPPPTMLAFDAPTRESCTIKRSATNTPMQALALWNDEQFVEAARALAERTLAEPGNDTGRLARLITRCTGRSPDEAELARLTDALRHFRGRFRVSPDDAGKLLAVGERPRDPAHDPAELAAWTMIANAGLCLDAAVTRN